MDFLETSIKQFQYYKSLGDGTLKQLKTEDLFWQIHEQSNSIAIIIKHLNGNMLSRFNEFLSSDGEKEWRNREAEFELENKDAEQVLAWWSQGWDCLFKALDGLTEADLDQIVYIRNQGHTVRQAILRQVAHYAYHVGQIVLIGTMLKGADWQSLSIPKGSSRAYNADKFAQEKRIGHFTDEFRNK